tara:strand:- start:16103 stop:16738 length:636 start_codon:yes stop_codon:yes gene_type:complete
MSVLKTYFDKTYCINLERRPDRWSKVIVEFKKVGFFDDVTKYKAIDGKELDTSKFKHNPNLLLGELGVMETHINIIREAKESEFSSILIVEDDVQFTNEINDLKGYMDSVPDNWDMIYFGGNHIYGKPPIKVNDKIIRLNKTVALQCVAIRNTVYDKILNLTRLRNKQIDGYYADLHPVINAYGFTPNMAVQTIDYSDIQNKVVNYTNFFK